MKDEETTSPTGADDELEDDDSSPDDEPPPDYLDPKPMDPTGR
jgi:hypothetical protein